MSFKGRIPTTVSKDFVELSKEQLKNLKPVDRSNYWTEYNICKALKKLESYRQLGSFPEIPLTEEEMKIDSL